MDANTLPDFVRDFFKRFEAECIPRIERATVPFYAIQDDEVKLDRTGVLYSIAGHHFILTASHDLGAIVRYNIPLYVDRTDHSSLPIPLSDAVFHCTEKERRDVAAIKISDKVAEQLRPNKEFLTHADVRLTDQGGDALYVLFGYPERWFAGATESALVSAPLVYLCRPYEGEVGFDPKLHVLLGFNQAAENLTEGKSQELPPPYGVSGCGIWRVAEWSKSDLDCWRPDQLSLVALQHSWSEERKYVRGTWLGYALGLIQDNYPDVAAAMSLVYPKR